jgi:DNA ligase-1
MTTASAPFADLAAVADATRAASKRLEKMALLGGYFAGLGDDDLARACRFLAGRPFPAHDERTLNVGGSAVIAVLCDLAGIAPEEYGAHHVRTGDIGDVAADIMPPDPVVPGPPLTLADVALAYDALAATAGTIAKATRLRALLARAGATEAKYLIKICTGEMRTGVKESLIEEALARQAGLPVAAVQAANMLLGDIGALAVRVRHGQLGDVALSLFHPLKSMLASPTTAVDELLAAASDTGTLFIEDKYDGVRAQAHKEGPRVELYSRTLDPVTHRFPEVVAALAAVPHDFILDGEVVAFAAAAADGAGRCLPFSALQKRLGRKTVSAALLAEVPVAYMAFDLLALDGVAQLDRPLAERRAALEALLHPWLSATIRLGELVRLPVADLAGAAGQGRLDALFAAAQARGNEGLVVKHPSSVYSPGKRGRAWLKVKRALATLDVVVTAVEWGQGKRHHLLSDYTFAVRDGDRLLNIGKAYSGLTDAELTELTQWFVAHTVHDFRRGRTVVPEIVIEVAFDAIQPSPRHKSGYALRFPRIVRLRPDKPVSEINTLADVRAMVGDE